MELTKLQKALILSSLETTMEELGIESNLKPSECMFCMSILVGATEDMNEEEKGKFAVETYQDTIRKIYDELAKE